MFCVPLINHLFTISIKAEETQLWQLKKMYFFSKKILVISMLISHKYDQSYISHQYYHMLLGKK